MGNANIGKISKKFPKIRIIETEDFVEAINMVLNGKVSATYDAQTAIENRIENELIDGLKGIPQKAFKSSEVRFFSRIDEPLLQSILQKGLDDISYLEKHKIITKWISSEKSINWTNDELKWLDKHKAIKYVYDPSWEPLEWSNEMNEHEGIISDFVKLVSEISGINFREINSKTWSKAVQKVENKKASMYSGVGETKERKEYMNFTKNSFLTAPYVFVSRDGEDYIDGFEASRGKKIATLASSTIEGILKEKDITLALIWRGSKTTKDGGAKVK
jgi:ABC-type amino acid transport substrate-binding protein